MAVSMGAWRHTLLWAAGAGLLTITCAAPAQQIPTSRIGYVYPAGAGRGTTLEVTVGGQLLASVKGARVSRSGVTAEFVAFDRPLNQREVMALTDRLQEAQMRLAGDENSPRGRAFLRNPIVMLRLAQEAGITDEELRKLNDFQRDRADPKKQPNAQIEQEVKLRITVEPDAVPGPREIRLQTPVGLTNPVRFVVGTATEARESEPNDETATTHIDGPLPVVINGQILPGDTDRFSFAGRAGQRIAVRVHARALIPFLADAVPGWFQPVAAIYDSKGRELAYADHHGFDPDPEIACRLPDDGTYFLQIRDALHRGREDFIYRIELSDLPATAPTATKIASSTAPGTRSVNESEPNDTIARAQRVAVPVEVSGRIGSGGDLDVYRFEARAGSEIVAEVTGRRSGSPIDSFLRLTDTRGKEIAFNDDFEDPSQGILTHHADSLILARLPAGGAYFITVGDSQQNGGPGCAYRLRISPPRPDFELRIAPSAINARAGWAAPVTVTAIRRDGFAGDISLSLRAAPSGYGLSGARIPAGQDRVTVTLSVPSQGTGQPIRLEMEGYALIGGREIRRIAVPAEDMMQAFAYRHMVPSDEWLVTVSGSARARQITRLLDDAPVRIPAGGSATVRIAGPMLLGYSGLEAVIREAPEGVMVRRVSEAPGGVTIELRADAARAKPGATGNLVLDAVAILPPPARARRPNAPGRLSLGTLPAIPFEIVK